MNIDGRYVVGIWLAAKPGTWNWMANVSKNSDGHPEGPGYTIETRLRLEVDDKLGMDSEDPKYWQDYHVSLQDGKDFSEDILVRDVKKLREQIITNLCLFHRAAFQEEILEDVELVDLEIRSSDQDFIFKRMAECPFFHVTKLEGPPPGYNTGAN